MGYRVSKTTYGRGWKIKFECRKNNTRKTYTIKPDEFLDLGFYSAMTIEGAKDRVRVLNLRLHENRVHEVRRVVKSRIESDRAEISLYFPPTLLEKFEQKMRILQVNKWKSHWRAAQIMLIRLKMLTPKEWTVDSEVFYDYFLQKGWSISYVQKILYICNAWGDFYSRNLSSYFVKLQGPTGVLKQRLADKHFDSKGTAESKPLTPELLSKVYGNISELGYNWLYLSLWLGLRPSEVDRLKKPSSQNTWYTTVLLGHTIVWLYQSKLTNIPRHKRYKGIPLLTEEQQGVIKIIEEGKFKRPLCKTICGYLGPGYTTYAGRKGFSALMLRKGYAFEKISKWMGHQSIDRTWKSYTDKTMDLI